MTVAHARVHVVFYKIFVIRLGDDASLRRKGYSCGCIHDARKRRLPGYTSLRRRSCPLWLYPRRWEASSPIPPIGAEYPTAFYNFPLHLQCKCKGKLVKTRGTFVKTCGKNGTKGWETYDGNAQPLSLRNALIINDYTERNNK